MVWVEELRLKKQRAHKEILLIVGRFAVEAEAAKRPFFIALKFCLLHKILP